MKKLFLVQLYNSRGYDKTMFIVEEERRVHQRIKEMGYSASTFIEITEVDGYDIVVIPKK